MPICAANPGSVVAVRSVRSGASATAPRGHRSVPSAAWPVATVLTPKARRQKRAPMVVTCGQRRAPRRKLRDGYGSEASCRGASGELIKQLCQCVRLTDHDHMAGVELHLVGGTDSSDGLGL